MMDATRPVRPLVGAVLVTFVLAATAVLAGTPAFDKGFSEGTAFGMRTGQKKGFADGHQLGIEDGHQKGMADAQAGVDNPAPPVPTVPPADTPPVVVAPDVPVADLPADDLPADDDPTLIDSPSAEDLPEEALRRYPHLLPHAPSLEGYTDEVVVDPTTISSSTDGFGDDRRIISDDDLAYGTEYSKGFALGYLDGYKKTYASARDEGYLKGYSEGYRKGILEYKDLHYGPDGQPLTAEEQYRKGRALLLQEKYEAAIVRFDLVAAAGFDNEWVDDALYWKAWACYTTTQFGRAIRTVSQMLEILPDSELADDALYCKGMCYEYLQTGGFLGMGVQKHYVEAAECFYNLIACYPTSPIVPDAYYRLGFNYERLKAKSAAIKAYRVVVENYPNSSVAFKATQRLKALGAM